MKNLKEKEKEPSVPEPEPEPTTEVLFLCSYDNCGKTFIDAGALRKHSHIHGERQFVCHYEGCGKVVILLLIDAHPTYTYYIHAIVLPSFENSPNFTLPLPYPVTSLIAYSFSEVYY